MNWDSAQYSELKKVKKRLKKDWQLQGAVGIFTRISKVRIDRFRGGQKYWYDKDFIIMNLNNVDAMGASEPHAIDRPFAIAGMNLFWDETLLIDFQANYIAIKPKSRKQIRSESSTGNASIKLR